MYKPHRVSSNYLKKLNRDFSRIGRVVVLPKYRNIGVGTELVRKTLPLVGTPYVETLAVMAKYNPFFEKAGMLTPKQFEWRDREYEQGLQELEAECYRLGQELLKLKQQGREPKHKKLSKIEVKRLALVIGTSKLKTLSYQEFEALCKQHKI